MFDDVFGGMAGGGSILGGWLVSWQKCHCGVGEHETKREALWQMELTDVDVHTHLEYYGQTIVDTNDSIGPVPV